VPTPGGDGQAWSPEPARGEPSAWMVVPVVAGALALIVLGVHPPAELNELLARAVSELGGAA
jgi:hydrogenase-4 component F